MDNQAKLKELEMRRGLCQAAIRIIDAETGDPRRPAALERYKAQLAEIDQRITTLTGTPPPVVVGLQAAQLFGKTRSEE